VDFFQNLTTQIAGLWARWSRAQQAAMVGGVVLCVAIVAGVGYWSLQPDYVPLASGLSPADAAEIVSTLEAERISYKLNFSGSAISVAKSDLNRARLASKEQLGVSSGKGESDATMDIWADPALTHVRLLRQQETRLARSIGQLKTIKSATVHISKPETSPFVRDQGKTTASVVVELRPGAIFTGRDAAAVVSLLSHGIEGLEPSAVSVMDTEGRLLTSEGGMEGDVAGQLEYRRRLETGLAAKAETMLAEVLGPGRAVVRVTADVDFTQTTSTQKTYDPDGKVKSNEKIVSEQNSSSRNGASGVAGTGSNIGGAAGGGQNSPFGNKREESETTYLNAETTNTVAEAPGKIRRITVAAVVEIPPPAPPAAGSTALATTPTLDKASIEALIKSAVGFDTERSDQVDVVLAKLASGEAIDAVIPMTSSGESVANLIRAASLGVATLVIGALGYVALRRMRPVVVEPLTQTEISLSAAKRLATLAEQARANPEAVAEVIKAWIAQTAQNKAAAPRRVAA
jgi:flagellar M-ring protein FliF